MQLDFKGVATLVVVVAVLVVGAYSLGLNQGTDRGTQVSPVANAPSAGSHPDVSMPMGHPSPTSAAPPEANNHFNHFRVGNRNVKSMFADGNDVWVGTSGGVIRYDLKTDNYQLYDVSKGNLLSNGVFHVSKLGNRIAVGTYGGGLSLYDPATDKWKNINIPDGLADQFVYDVLVASNGDVWIATWSGVNRVRNGKIDDPTQWTTFNVENTHGGLPNDWVYGVEEGKDGALWFATEQGVARFKDDKWQHWQHEDGIGASYEQVKDDIKFSSDPANASQHHAKQKADQGLSNVKTAYNPNYIVSLVIDRKGTVWGGTWGGGLARFDGKAWRNFTVKEGLPSNHVFSLYVDPKGRLWAGTSHGLARLNDDGRSFTVMTTRDGLYADNVFSMTTSVDGSFWVGSFGGVARLFGVND